MAYVGEIRLFAGNYAPPDWAVCDGQLLGVADHPELGNLLGAMYGGDGSSNFALPDLRGSIIAGAGAGPMLTPRGLGIPGGSDSVALTLAQYPAHQHDLLATSEQASTNNPAAAMFSNTASDFYYLPTGKPTPHPLASSTVGPSDGRGEAHDNCMPTLIVNYIIALRGDYPVP